MVMTARVMLGWVDPDELHPVAEGAEDADADAGEDDDAAATKEAGV